MRTDAAASIVLLAASGMAACATLRPDAAFTDVQRLVGARGPAVIHWNQGTPEDSQVDERIRALLGSELTAESAVQIALFNNRALQATYERLGVAQADLVQAGLLPNPVVHAAVRFPVTSPGTGAEVGVVQDFIRALQIPFRRRVAAAALEAAKLEVGEAVMNLAADVKVAFYTLQGAEQMLELRRTVAEAEGYSADFARRQHEAGNITDFELVSEQALFEQARLDVARAEEDVFAAREEMNALLGLWGNDTKWAVAVRLPRTPREELPRHGLESLAVTQRLELAAARQSIAQLAQTLRLARVEGFIPTADVGVDSELEPDGGWGVGPSVELPIPLFDFGRAAIARAAAELRQSQERYRALAVEVRAEVRRARTRAEAGRRRADHYRRVVLPLRRRVVEETQLQYNAMQVGLFQLLEAKRDEIEAGGGYVESLTDYWVARAELERAVGGELALPAEAPSASDVPAAPDSGKDQSGGTHHH